jgi:hypothetical protein
MRFDSPGEICYVFIMQSNEYLRQVVSMLSGEIGVRMRRRTCPTLDYERMAKVVEGLAALEAWGKSEV